MGVVHRDVKPANIMIDGRGEALLMDFGLARLASDEEKLTQDGSLMGTPAYMAPEQADASFGRLARPATSTAWAWCCTSCSAARRRSAVRPRY